MEQVLEDEVKRTYRKKYPDMTKKYDCFELNVKSGDFTDSEIIVMLGENGTGKTTFIQMLAGRLQPDGGGQYITRLYTT